MARPLRVPVVPLVAGEYELDEATTRYVVRVHRLRVGDEFAAFDPDAAVEADARVVQVDQRVRCFIGDLRPAQLVAPLSVTLLQAIGKGDKLDQVVRDATVLGATRIVAVETERTVVRLGARAESRRQRWHSVAVQAARQCGRGDSPIIEGPVALGEALAQGSGPGALRVCLDADGVRLAQLLEVWDPMCELVLLAGPEGGLSEGEQSAAIQAGFQLGRVGRFVLRTETVAAAALGAIAAQYD